MLTPTAWCPSGRVLAASRAWLQVARGLQSLSPSLQGWPEELNAAATSLQQANRRDYQIGSRGGVARLTLGRCATTVGFGYAVTGASAGLSGDEDRVGPIMQALQGTPCLAATQAKL